MEKNFNYQNLPVRIVTDESEQTWFAGIDVCNILNYAKPTQAIEKLDEDERKLDLVKEGSGQRRKTWMINESGLYSLIITSSKPEAKAFKKWITSELLPTIRKAGKWTSEEEKEYELYIQTLLKDIETFEENIKAANSKTLELKTKLADTKAKLFKALRRDKSQLSIPFPKK